MAKDEIATVETEETQKTVDVGKIVKAAALIVLPAATALAANLVISKLSNKD